MRSRFAESSNRYVLRSDCGTMMALTWQQTVGHDQYSTTAVWGFMEN